jgi:hypothetical protein
MNNDDCSRDNLLKVLATRKAYLSWCKHNGTKPVNIKLHRKYTKMIIGLLELSVQNTFMSSEFEEGINICVDAILVEMFDVVPPLD